MFYKCNLTRVIPTESTWVRTAVCRTKQDPPSQAAPDPGSAAGGGYPRYRTAGLRLRQPGLCWGRTRLPALAGAGLAHPQVSVDCTVVLGKAMKKFPWISALALALTPGRQPTSLPPRGWRNLHCVSLSQHPSTRQEAIRVLKTKSGCGCLLIIPNYASCGQRALQCQRFAAPAPTVASSAFSIKHLGLAAALYLTAQRRWNSGVTKWSQICCNSLLVACEKIKCIKMFKWETFIITGNLTANWTRNCSNLDSLEWFFVSISTTFLFWLLSLRNLHSHAAAVGSPSPLLRAHTGRDAIFPSHI